MRTSTDMGQHAQKPEYRQALQELIKYELQALVERLSETGEEAVILTASLQDGTSTQFASTKAEGFLLNQKTLASQFLSYFNDDVVNSSGDELCTFDEDIDIDTSTTRLPNSGTQYASANDNAHSKKDKSPTLRSRERTTSRRLSLSRDDKKTNNMYEVSQTSDMSASERNDSASSVSSFVEAREQDDDVNPLQCKICNRNFRSYKTLNFHVRRHMVKSYKCNFCGKIFSVKSTYQRHIKTHKKNKLFDCGFCDQSFPDQLSWKQHRERHFGARNFSCNLCGKAFYEKYSLRVHQTSHFISTQKFEKNLDSNSGFSCHICQKFSKTKATLKIHILTHSAKKHACEFCNKRFSLKYSYIRHRRIHTGEKPYKCGSCGKSFSDSSAWAKHVRTHSGVKPYSCDICSRSFYDRTACKTHMKSHQNKLRQQAEEDKRNFDILSGESVSKKHDEKLFAETIKEPVVTERKFESHDRKSEMFVQLGLPLDESDKEFDHSNLLDSGFDQDLMGDVEEADSKTTDIIQGKMSPILDSVELDEKFQKEFVERNMPIKGIESDSELISTTFPDDAELLEETEPEKPEKCNKKTDTFILQSSQDKPLAVTRENTPLLLRKFVRKPVNRKPYGKGVPESPSKCKKCHRTFKQDSLLKQHLQFHCMMKLYKCRFCGKQLSTKHSLVRHERIHIGERPYQCYLCQKTFADNYGCIRHVKTHFNTNNRSIAPFSITKNNIVSTSQDGPELSRPQEGTNSLNLGIGKFSDNFSLFKASETQPKQPTAISEIRPTPALSQLDSQQTKDETGKSQPVINQITPTCAENQTTAQESKSLYRCYNCSSLFPSQQDCIHHIQQSCNKSLQAEFISIPHSSESSKPEKEPPQLKNIYQCSVCKMMFNDESACRLHQAQKCCKQNKSDEGTAPTLIQETIQYTSPHSKDELDHLPSLPFPDINSEQPLLDLNEDMMLTSHGYPDSNLPETPVDVCSSPDSQSNVSSPSTYLTYKSVPGSSNTSPKIGFQNISNQETSPLRTEITFTGLVPKPLSVSQGKYFITSQGLSLVNTPNINSVLATPPESSPKPDEEMVVSARTDKAPKKTQSESSVEERTCTICNKLFTNKHILKQHVLIHMERKFGCKYCLKKFHNKYGRDRHERIHTGEKPYSCPTCRKAFSDNSTYRKHTRVCCN